MTTIEITQQKFEELLKTSEIVILDFWASWCGPCRMFAPIFEKVAAQNPGITFGKVNTEEEQELAAAFQIRSIPTVAAFKQGVLVFMQPGMLPEPGLVDLVDQLKALDMTKEKEKRA